MRRLTFNRSTRRDQAGQMSIEFAIVIVLVAMVLAGAVYYLTQGRGATKVNDAVAGVTSILAKSQTLYANDPNGFANITSQSLIDNGAVPSKMTQGANIYSPFGGVVTVAPGDVYSGGVGSGVTFTIGSVPSSACSDFVNSVAPSFVNVKVGTTDVRTNGQNVTSYAQSLGTACKANSATVTLTAGR